MRIVWQLAVIAAISYAGSAAMAAVKEHPWPLLAIGLATAVLAVTAHRWIVTRTEHRNPVELARDRAVAKTATGTLIGAAMFAFVIANIAFLGHYDIHGLGSPAGAAGLLGFMAAAAVTEEILYRGVLLRHLERWTGTWIALALTSALFGAAHLLNPDATLWGVIAIAIEAGAMLGAAYIATRNLWVPIGVHFGWNFAASGIFSTVVSGNGTTQGLLDAATSGPTPVTGGDFGPEGSIYAVLFGTLLTAGFLWLAKRRGHIVPRRRTQRTAALATLPR